MVSVLSTPSELKSRIETPFTFSQSSLQDYADCPRRFQLRYIERINWPAVESEPAAEFEIWQREGLLFHRLAQQHLLGLPSEKLERLANTPNLSRWWQNYIHADFGLDGYALRSEPALFCAVGEHRLVAKYDLIAIRDGQAIIYDWKTHTRRPRTEWLAARWQTRIYRAVLARAGMGWNDQLPLKPDQIRMIYWFAEFPEGSIEFRYDAQQLKHDWSTIEELVAQISSARNFPLAEDQKMCRFCVYRSYCDRGARAADWPDAEAEPDAADAFDLNFEQVAEIEF